MKVPAARPCTNKLYPDFILLQRCTYWPLPHAAPRQLDLRSPTVQLLQPTTLLFDGRTAQALIPVKTMRAHRRHIRSLCVRA